MPIPVARLALAIILAATAGLPARAGMPVEKLLAQASATCAAIDGGIMTVPEGAVTEVDFSGENSGDALLDESKLVCSTAASAYCGSGGCMLHAVIGDKVTSWQATGWRIIDWEQDKILLIGRDGGWCGGVGAERCYEAVVWSDGRFLTVAPPEDSETE